MRNTKTDLVSGRRNEPLAGFVGNCQENTPSQHCRWHCRPALSFKSNDICGPFYLCKTAECAETPPYFYAATPNSASNLAHTLSSTGVAAARIFASSCAAFKLPIGLP